MLQWEHSAILSTFTMLDLCFVFFEWLLKTSFTVLPFYPKNQQQQITALELTELLPYYLGQQHSMGATANKESTTANHRFRIDRTVALLSRSTTANHRFRIDRTVAVLSRSTANDGHKVKTRSLVRNTHATH